VSEIARVTGRPHLLDKSVWSMTIGTTSRSIKTDNIPDQSTTLGNLLGEKKSILFNVRFSVSVCLYRGT
jgi:hypothetical protein